jgi:hypothetical protein
VPIITAMSPVCLARSICTAVLCGSAALVHAAPLPPPALDVAVSDSTLAVNSEGRVMVPSTQTMVWSRLQPLRLGVGVGVEQRLQGGPTGLNGADAAPRNSALLTMGVSVKTGASSHLSWQTQWPTSRVTGDGLGAERRPGWSLRQRDPMATLRAGALFKAQLSDQTVITLRPRRGQAVVTLQHRW